MKNNIAKSGEIRPCTSCQVCGAVCPVNAISIKLNSDGYYRPTVDEEKCIDCGLCVKSCYKYDITINKTINFSNKKLYAAKAISKDIINETTSGGIADLLAQELIKQGYTCIGVAYDSELNCAIGQTATTIEETKVFRGSKYIQSLSVDVFKQLVKQSKTKKQKFAIFGLPCQIYALNRFLTHNNSREPHIFIDLYCHGCPSLNVWNKYIDSILKKTDGKKILSVNFRSKLRGWGNFVVSVAIKGDTQPIMVTSSRINDPFYSLFFSDLVLNDSCSSCELRSTLEYTDIRLGDFWGHKFVSDHTGMSGVTICSEQGYSLFENIRNQAYVTNEEFNSFLPYQSYGKLYHPNESKRRLLLNMLADEKNDIYDIVNTYKRLLPLKTKVFISLKNIIKLLPNSIISFSKGLLYKITK